MRRAASARTANGGTALAGHHPRGALHVRLSGDRAAFLRSLATDTLTVEALTSADYGRAAELVDGYRDLPLGTVDATVIAVAERLHVTTIATLDRRHFSVVRPDHTTHFELLP